jgi:hypothetical protein
MFSGSTPFSQRIDCATCQQAFLALNASQLDTEKSELQKDRHAFKSAMEQYAATQNGGCGLQWRTAC